MWQRGTAWCQQTQKGDVSKDIALFLFLPDDARSGARRVRVSTAPALTDA